MAPHFNRLGQALMKSTKFHMKRAIGARHSTCDELHVLYQVLALLKNDLDFLIPGHFLIGVPLLAKYELNVTQILLNRLSQWQLTILSDHFGRSDTSAAN